MADPLGLTTFAVEKGYFWSARPEGVRFGSVGEGDEYALNDYTAVFSSSSIFTGVPESLSDNFFKLLLEDIDAEIDDGMVYTSCSNEFSKDIFFMFAGNWLQIRAQDLIVDISEAQDGTLCAVTFIPTTNDYWWFGHNIYKDYYVIHNMSKRTLGFVPTLDNLKGEIMDGAKPVSSFPSYNWIMMLVKLGVGAVWAVGIWVLIDYGFKPASFTGINFLN